jgi:hypothetical protein
MVLQATPAVVTAHKVSGGGQLEIKSVTSTFKDGHQNSLPTVRRVLVIP